MTHPSLQEIKILVVDDIAAARKITLRLLKKLGIENLSESENGTSALKWLDENDAPDIILTDLHLKDITGIELCESARAKNVNSPFIIMTSDADRDEIIRAKEVGIKGYLLKPFDKNSLQDKLIAALESAAE